MRRRQGTRRPARSGWRIRAVVSETGISRELVHHYLRQGLLPKLPSRALYDDRHVRLLRQIRLLREEHELPLEVIRRLFRLFDFDPDRIEVLGLCESLGRRSARFASRGELLEPDRLSASDVASRAAITPERLADYVAAGVVTPHRSNGGQESYSAYDTRIAALCEHGLRLGIPFQAFRSIASYVRIGFDLEHEAFYGLKEDARREPSALFGELFLRQEVTASFLQSLLFALTSLRLQDLLEPAAPPARCLDDLIYAPSDAFVRRHGLDSWIQRSREALGREARRPKPWVELAEALRHAGRYDEAALVSEEGAERWRGDDGIATALARVRILRGDEDGARKAIPRGADPVTSLLLAVASLAVTSRKDATTREVERLASGVDEALRRAESLPDAERLEARMLAGWLLLALPPLLGDPRRGARILTETLRELGKAPEMLGRLPAYRERLMINTAFLLLKAPLPPKSPSPEELRDTVCRLDPCCRLAELAFAGAGAGGRA